VQLVRRERLRSVRADEEDARMHGATLRCWQHCGPRSASVIGEPIGLCGRRHGGLVALY
jgi:hypothetical protein